MIFGLVVFRGAPYVPSRKLLIRQALKELYPLTNKDVLVDIGSGDGVALRVASKLGARAVGYEINPILVIISRFLSRKDKRVTVRLADFWLTRLPDDTTVVYVFLVDHYMEKVKKRMQSEADRLEHPIHMISLGFDMDGIKPIKTVGAYHLYLFGPLQSGKAQV